MLCNPGLEERTYRQIAKEAGISLVRLIGHRRSEIARVSDRQQNKGDGIQNRKELLKRWVAAYPEQLRPKLLIGRSHKEGARDWWQTAELPPESFLGWRNWRGANDSVPQTGESLAIYSETKSRQNYKLNTVCVAMLMAKLELLRKFWVFSGWDEQHRHVVPRWDLRLIWSETCKQSQFGDCRSSL